MNGFMFIRFIASYLIWFMFLGVFVMFLKEKRLRRKIIYVLFTAILVWVTSEMIKALIPATRPFLLNGRGIKTMTLHFDHSFPSSHTAVAFALATAIYFFDKKLGKIYIILAFLVGLGRYLANVHFMVDIVVGALLGIGINLLLKKYKIIRV